MNIKFYYGARHICFLLVTVTMAVNTYAQGFSPQTVTRLQHVLESFQANPANPAIGGMSAAIKVDGLAFWQGATGYSARRVDSANNLLPGGARFRAGTLSHMYSITKTFTAPLVLQLAQEGVFSLDDPIRKYMTQIDAYNKNSINTSVTIRQLLAHTSGYSDWEEEQDLLVAIAYAPTHQWTPYELVAYTHQLDAPGKVSRYAHNNYVFLGAIIEAATGKRVETLYRERFFEPLHLASMYMAGREIKGKRKGLASPHDNISPFNPVFQLTGQPTFPDTVTNISRFPMKAIISLAFTGGALVSDAADLTEWGNALFGGRATSKTVLTQMLQSISPVADEFGNKLGYGIKLYDRFSTKDIFYGHNGSAPGYRSVMIYNPKRKMTIAFLSNFAGIDPYAVAKALFEALPDFTCANQYRNEAMVRLCWYSHSFCIPRQAAGYFIKWGAYLGNCDGSKTERNLTNNELTQKNTPVQPEQKGRLNAFPNPFRNSVDLSFRTTQSGRAVMRIYDSHGKLITTLFDGMVQKGILQKVVLQAGNLPSGIYISQLQTTQGTLQQKLVLER